MTFDEWRAAFPDAAAALVLVLTPAPVTAALGGNEDAVQSRVRLRAARLGWHLWRNNIGAMQDKTGRVIRYGLANDSKALNTDLKSGDLIGWKPNGQFVSLEVKASNWRYTGNGREVAQMAWASLVCAGGGDGRFVTSEDQLT